MFETHIKKLRLNYELRQFDLEYLLNIGRRAYSDIENGITFPRTIYVIKLALLYNVTTDYILGVSNEPGHFSKDNLKSLVQDYDIDYAYIQYLQKKITTGIR